MSGLARASKNRKCEKMGRMRAQDRITTIQTKKKHIRNKKIIFIINKYLIIKRNARKKIGKFSKLAK